MRVTRTTQGSSERGVGAFITTALAALGLLVGAVRAEASCVSGCNAQKRECIVGAAIPVKLSCKAGCAAVPDKAACLRLCADEFRLAKADCKADRSTCRGICTPGEGSGVDGACIADCGHDLGDCARGNADDVRSCMTVCKEAKGPGFPDCVKACGASAAAGAKACNDAFRTCAGRCGATVPSTTLPPGSTTMPPASTTTTSTTTVP